jgi:hypothetical protein
MNITFAKEVTLPIELQLMVRSLGLRKQHHKNMLYETIDQSDIDWDFFLKLVVTRHRLTGPVYKNLVDFGQDLIPHSVLTSLKKQYRYNSFQMMKKVAELVKLTTLFTQEGIRALPFKGPVLGAQLFPEDLAMRQSTDLDIVVPLDQLTSTEKVLVNAGYQAVEKNTSFLRKQHNTVIRKGIHTGYFNPESKIKIELHWNFFSNGLCSIGFDEVWKNRETIQVGGRDLPSCTLDDITLLLFIHGAKHCWRRLFWLNDILVILEKYTAGDWQKLMKRSEKLGITRLVLSTIFLLHLLFHFEVPDQLHALAKRDTLIPLLIQMSLFHVIQSDDAFLVKRFSFFKPRLWVSNFFLVPDNRYKFHYITRS